MTTQVGISDHPFVFYYYPIGPIAISASIISARDVPCVSYRIQVRPLFASNNDPSDGAKTGVAEPYIAEQSRSWWAASGEQGVMRGS